MTMSNFDLKKSIMATQDPLGVHRAGSGFDSEAKSRQASKLLKTAEKPS